MFYQGNTRKTKDDLTMCTVMEEGHIIHICICGGRPKVLREEEEALDLSYNMKAAILVVELRLCYVPVRDG